MRLHFPASLRVIGRSFVDWWDGWLDTVVMTLVWVVAQVTVILGPPATFGVYYVIHDMVVDGQAQGIPGMIRGARMYFGKAWLWGLINLLVVGILVINIYFYGGIKAFWGLYLQVFVLMVLLVWIMTQFYALAYFMELETKSLWTAMKNGLFTSLAAPFFTFVIIVLVIILTLLSFGLVIPLFLGLFGVIPFLAFRAIDDRLVAFGLRKPEKTPKEIEYEESGRLKIPSLERFPESGAVNSDAPISGAPDGDASDVKGQVEQEE